MQVIADLEVHSKYARAVSSSMTVPVISEWARKKGIDLVGTGDFTHPMWLRELEANLEEAGEGVYRFKKWEGGDVKFLLTSEVSCIYTHEGKGRRVHLMVYLPSFDSVHKFNKGLTERGANLFSDGRPIIGLTLAQVAEIALSANEHALIIPAHVWTPWFGFYGHMSGYNSLLEAFGDLEKHIPAVETGLSSDPAMNWRINELSNKRIVSFGDAHSPQKLGREATVFELPEISYENVWKALWGEKGSHISYTIEFYPEEGKYHYTGHRKCNVVYSPKEARKMGMTCPVCGRNLTMGVMGRVEALASEDIETKAKIDKLGSRWISDKQSKNPPYVMLVPLLEIIAEALGVGVNTKTVTEAYDGIIDNFASEFEVLLKTPIDQMKGKVDAKVIDGIKKVRSGDIYIKPGYDGIFGTLKIWSSGSYASEDKKEGEQNTLF